MLPQRSKNYFPLLTTALIAVVFSLLNNQPVMAHSSDTYYQSYSIYLIPQEALIEWRIYPSTLYSQAVWNEADTDKNGEVSSTEARVWAGDLLNQIQISLDTSINLDLQLEVAEWPESFPEFGLEHKPILLNLRASWPTDTIGIHQLEINNQYYQESSIHWFSVQSVDGVYFYMPEEHSSLVRLKFFIPTISDTGENQPLPTGENYLLYWDSGTPRKYESSTLQATTGDGEDRLDSSPQSNETRTPTEILTNLISLPELSTGNYLLILGTTLLLGGIHALTPGHGKALVAAYLVGIRGTLRHAAVLGGIITMTHTGSVLAIGAVTLIASQYLLLSILTPGLELLSSVAIIIIGMYMIRRGWRGYRAVRRTHRLSLSTNEDNTYTQRIVIDEEIQTRVYDDLLPEDDFSLTKFSWRSLLALGVSGGLVPCPDAVVILFVAAAINRVYLGIALILAFSVGMAIVLIAIGFAFVRGRGLLENFKPFRSISTIVPMISGFIVLGMGIAISFGVVNSAAFQWISPLAGDSAVTTIEVQPDGTLENESGTALTDKSFNIKTASVLYLGTDRKGRSQLFRLGLSDGESYQLTKETSEVMEYALSPDGGTAVYSVHDAGVKCELWGLDVASNERLLITAYDNSECSGLTWSPDSSRIVYQVLDQSNDSIGELASLWWLDLDTGKKEHVFQNDQYPRYNPRWSPDGKWLSYSSLGISPTLEIYNLQDGSRKFFPTQTIASPMWSPDGKALLIIDLRGDGNDKTMHLVRLSIESSESTDLSKGDGMYDRYAAWAPDGSSIAVVRLMVKDKNGLLEDQILLLRPDDGNARQLTTCNDCLHSQPVWSPDGKYLLFDRIFLDDDAKQSSIWILYIETGNLTQIAEAGYQPVWLP